MTSSSHQHIPEPSFPEHDLIRSADQLPELSSGLRSTTLLTCEQQIYRVRRMKRLQYTAAGVLALTLVLGVSAILSISTEAPSSAVVEQPASAPPSTPHTTSPYRLRSPGETGAPSKTVISLGNNSTNTELEAIDKRIEDLQRRCEGLLDGNLLTGF